MDTNRTYNGSSWIFDENKRLKVCAEAFSDDCDDKWEKIAAMIPEKSIEEIKQQHYKLLEKDVNAIDSGHIPLPEHKFSSSDPMQIDRSKRIASFQERREEQRRKGMPWSEEEHRLFIVGLERHGKGDWRSIARNFVPSRTPAQVASHAQKYFIRLRTSEQDKKRHSIHDITSADQADGSAPVVPITGARVVRADGEGSSSRSWKEPPPMSREELWNFVPPCIVESFDCAMIPTLDLPPPDYTFPEEMVYDFDDPNPASLVPSDPMDLASMDFLEPSFFDRMF